MQPLDLKLKRPPVLDPGFLPAALWNRAFRQRVEASGGGIPLGIALTRPDGSVSSFETRVLPHGPRAAEMNIKYVERLVKLLLWQRGGSSVVLGGSPETASAIAKIYSPAGARAFDFEFMGDKIYGQPFRVESRALEELPAATEATVSIGRNFDGCRIGFDLGGSDRKCAALIDGEVVFTEEVPWDPYFQKDPEYHFSGIDHSLRRAAEKLPRVDAIGGSAAGVYVNNEVRVASLFRGVPPDLFEKRVRRMFFDLRAKWNQVPFEVMNDGDVTALAGSISLNDNAVLGLAMGTSQAGGYVAGDGHLTPWLNELAFVPIDYRPDAPVDEWSGDAGCGAKYFSQQVLQRLTAAAEIDLDQAMPLPEKLERVQELMTRGDPRAERIYQTVGAYLGYTVAHYDEFYDLRNLLVLGRVTSGTGGEVILQTARDVLAAEFPEVGERVRLQAPDEQSKRHGQAVVAASLPSLAQ